MSLGFLDGLFGHAIQWLGTRLAQRSFLNFTGGLKATDNPTNNSTDISFVGGGTYTFTTITETGHGTASTSGFINLGATSAGVWGGYASTEASLLGWVGATQALTLGSATDVESLGIDVATEILFTVGGNDRVIVDAGTVTLASPAGTALLIVQNGSVESDATTEVKMSIGGNARLSADATTSRLQSPNNSMKVETTNAGNTITGPAALTSYLDVPPITAPSNPASGWRLYTDTSDGKLKARNSSGTVRELAVP